MQLKLQQQTSPGSKEYRNKATKDTLTRAREEHKRRGRWWDGSIYSTRKKNGETRAQNLEEQALLT